MTLSKDIDSLSMIDSFSSSSARGLKMSVAASIPKISTTPLGAIEFSDGVNWYTLASEDYVQNAVSQISELICIAVSTSNLAATYANGTSGVGATLTSNVGAVFSIDSVFPAAGSAVLIQGQTLKFQNGIYTVTNVGSSAPSTSWVLTRSTDFDIPSQILQGTVAFVVTGTVNAATAWMQTKVVNTIGTDDIVFSVLSPSIVETTGQTTVSYSGSTATIGLATDTIIPGNGSITIPTGDTAQRPVTPVLGMLRLNTDLR